MDLSKGSSSLSSARSKLESLEEFKRIRSQELHDSSKQSQAAVLAATEKKLADQAEAIRLKESIRKLTELKNKKISELAKLEEDQKRKVDAAKKKLAVAEEMYGKSKTTVMLETANLKRKKRQRDKAAAYLKEVEIEKENVRTWLSSHSLNIYQTGGKTAIHIYDVNPYNREERFQLLFNNFVVEEDGQFNVTTVLPVFEEAETVMERANASNDLVRLINDCKKYWKRDCVQRFSNMSDGSTGTESDLNATEELF